MRLHRLELEHWRGVESCALDFDAGVTLVEGPNEVGKSSIVEALQLLFNYLDSSSAGPVKAVQPVHRDEGSRVLVELSAGELRLVFEKTFNRKKATVLTVSSPNRESETGRRAHERALELLAEHADLSLWKALLVIQGDEVGQAALGSQPSLVAALDRVAGAHDVAGDDAASEALMAVVETQYLRYYTKTGRPNADFARLSERVDDAESGCAAARLALEEVELKAASIADLERELARSEARMPAQQQRLSELEAKRVELGSLQARLDSCVEERTQTELDLDRLGQQLDRRQRLARAIEGLAQDLDAGGEQVRQASTRKAELHAALTAADSEATKLSSLAATAASGRRVLEATAAGRRRQERLASLRARLADVSSMQAEVESGERLVSTLPVTDAVLSDLRELNDQVERLNAQIEVASGELTIEADAELTLLRDGDRQQLMPSDATSLPLTRDQTVVIEGVATLNLRPDRAVATLAQRLRDAESRRADALAGHGLASYSDAVSSAEQRKMAEAQRAESVARLEALLGGDTRDALSLEVERLAGELAAMSSEVRAAMDEAESAGDAEARLAGASADEEAASRQAQLAARHLEAVRNDLAAVSDGLAELKAARASAEATMAEQRRQLESQRADASDETLLEQQRLKRERLDELDEQRRSLTEALAEQNAESVDAQHSSLKQAIERATSEQQTLRDRLLTERGGLDQVRQRGQHEALAAAEAEREAASGELADLQGRADAVACLREALHRHRDAARAAYLEPMTRAIENLGRIVFGSDLAIALSDDLSIASRTLGGVTVPFDALSVGAKEQLGILSRLAVAQIVAQEGGVPVILDDSLGFSDPERLSAMCAAIDYAARTCQVIVLTCTPERFADLGTARRVRLRSG